MWGEEGEEGGGESLHPKSVYDAEYVDDLEYVKFSCEHTHNPNTHNTTQSKWSFLSRD